MGSEPTVIRDLLDLLMWLEQNPGFIQRLRQEIAAPIATPHPEPTPPDNPDRLMTPNEAADFLGIDAQTLNNWRTTQRVQVPFLKVGRLVRYRRQDLETYLTKNTHGRRE